MNVNAATQHQMSAAALEKKAKGEMATNETPSTTTTSDVMETDHLDHPATTSLRGAGEKKQADLEFAKRFEARGDAGTTSGSEVRDQDEVYITTLGCRRPYPGDTALGKTKRAGSAGHVGSSDKSESDALPVTSAVSFTRRQQLEEPQAKRKRVGHQQKRAQAVVAGGPGRHHQQQKRRECGLEHLSDELLHKIFCHLDPVSLSSAKATNHHIKTIVDREDGLVWRAAMRNYCGDQCADHLAQAFPEVPADALARRVVTLENLKWTKRVVGGKVEPSRCNFSSCAVGDKIVIFGGDHGQHALNDTYVLDLGVLPGAEPARQAASADSQASTSSVHAAGTSAGAPTHPAKASAQGPEWKRLHMRESPPGRFGHTIRALNDHMCVLFGGCGNNGLFNDCYLLDLNHKHPQWKRVITHPGEKEEEDQGLENQDLNKEAATQGAHHQAPVERVWHAACVVQQSKLVVFGGCDKVGELLDDMQVLDLSPLLPERDHHHQGRHDHHGSQRQQQRPRAPPVTHHHHHPLADSHHHAQAQAPGVQMQSPDWRSVTVNPPGQDSDPKETKGAKAKPMLVDQIGQAQVRPAQAQALAQVAPPRTYSQPASALRWRRIDTGGGFKPPARIGHSLVVAEDEGTRVVVFGGIANVGPVRARDNSSFVIDIGEDEPRWTKLEVAPARKPREAKERAAETGPLVFAPHQGPGAVVAPARGLAGSPAPGGPAPSSLPSPRLDHVCWKLPGNRQIVFGGSPSVFGRGHASGDGHLDLCMDETKPEMFLLEPLKASSPGGGGGEEGDQGPARARWTKVEVSREGYEGPQSAWTHCACVMDHGTKCVVLGGAKGQDWLVNELHELSIMG